MGSAVGSIGPSASNLGSKSLVKLPTTDELHEMDGPTLTDLIRKTFKKCVTMLHIFQVFFAPALSLDWGMIDWGMRGAHLRPCSVRAIPMSLLSHLHTIALIAQDGQPEGTPLPELRSTYFELVEKGKGLLYYTSPLPEHAHHHHPPPPTRPRTDAYHHLDHPTTTTSSSSRGGYPTHVARSSDPAAPIAPSSEPAAPVAPSREPTAPVAPSREPTAPVAPSREPTAPVAPSREPTVPVAPSSDPVAPSAPSLDPAAAEKDEKGVSLSLFLCGTFSSHFLCLLMLDVL